MDWITVWGTGAGFRVRSSLPDEGTRFLNFLKESLNIAQTGVGMNEVLAESGRTPADSCRGPRLPASPFPVPSENEGIGQT
jgi:hypothetical protein